jgi:hypothetical protein
MYMKKFYLSLFFLGLIQLISVMNVCAQEANSDLEYLRMMETGVEDMEKGDYETADQYFRIAIENMKVLPTELCYFFGKNSFFLGKYKQSIDWLNKYIELKGVKGEFFDESVEYLKKSEQAYLTQQDRKQPTEEESAIADKQSISDRIDCSEGQLIVCPECKGAGVVKKPGLLGAIVYSTCPYGENGAMNCEDYKLYVKGGLAPKVKNP